MAAIKDMVSKVIGSSTLPTAQLGKDGPQVTRLGIGLMGLSAFYGKPKPDEQRLAFLDELYRQGELFWDTADMYADNEDLVGKWFKLNPEKRKDIFLATKFANKVGSDGSFAVDTSPEYALQACDKSLRRLGVDHIDLYYMHRLDGKTPVERSVEALVQLKKAGKIRHLGISECSAASLRRAHAVHPIAAVQMEYSPWSLDIEKAEIGLLAAARELGVAIVCYSPLARGIMSGRYRSPDDLDEGDWRKALPRFSKDNFAKNLEVVDAVHAIAKRKGCTASQLTLAWELRQGSDFFPIPGTTSVERLAENLGALKVELSDEEDREIRKLAEGAEVVGARYPKAAMHTLFADTPNL